MNSALQQAVGAMRRLQFEEAVSLLSQRIQSEPSDVQARWLLVQCLENLHRRDDALEQLAAILDLVRHDLAAIDRIAEHARRRRYPLDNVLRAYEAFMEASPTSENAVFNYAFNLARDGQFEAAVHQYLRALDLGIRSPEEVHLNIGNICMDHLNAHDKAREHLHKALEVNPGYSNAYYNLGNLAEQEGDRAEAASNFERCLQYDPANESALARLADTRTLSAKDDPLLLQLKQAALTSRNADIHFALGKAFENLGDFDLAWHHYSVGNAIDRASMRPYEPAVAAAHFERIRSACSRDWMDRYVGSSHESLFICGMFRSGSTLVEQMLAAHPAFVAGGEREFFPRLVSREFPDYPGGTENIPADKLGYWRQQHFERSGLIQRASAKLTDKRPDNFLYVGLIKAVLPSAKFIVTERDWRDIAASIYSVRLGPSQPYATSLESIRHYIDLQSELVDHWQEVLGEDLKRVSYEDLVRQPQETLTDLLAWLGEDWDEACLSFYELRNAVKTASVWQVRQPLHPGSVGRWEKFREHFDSTFRT